PSLKKDGRQILMRQVPSTFDIDDLYVVAACSGKRASICDVDAVRRSRTEIPLLVGEVRRRWSCIRLAPCGNRLRISDFDDIQCIQLIDEPLRFVGLRISNENGVVEVQIRQLLADSRLALELLGSKLVLRSRE